MPPIVRLLSTAALLSLPVGCASEPPFIEACQAECACTGDSFACREPRAGGCDNSYRRAWVLAGQKSLQCQAAYEAYFECLKTKSVCVSKSWEPPAGACDSVERPYRDCQ